jgi:hypothetical protein
MGHMNIGGLGGGGGGVQQLVETVIWIRHCHIWRSLALESVYLHAGSRVSVVGNRIGSHQVPPLSSYAAALSINDFWVDVTYPNALIVAFNDVTASPPILTCIAVSNTRLRSEDNAGMFVGGNVLRMVSGAVPRPRFLALGGRQGVTQRKRRLSASDRSV